MSADVRLASHDSSQNLRRKKEILLRVVMMVIGDDVVFGR